MGIGKKSVKKMECGYCGTRSPLGTAVCPDCGHELALYGHVVMEDAEDEFFGFNEFKTHKEPVKSQPPTTPKAPKAPKPPKQPRKQEDTTEDFFAPTDISETRPPRKKLLPVLLGAVLVVVLLAVGFLVGRLIPGNPTPSDTSIRVVQPTQTQPAASIPVTTEAETLPAVTTPRNNRILMNGGEKTEFFFGSDVTRDKIRSITFLNTTANAPADAWDASANGRGGVLAWLVSSGKLYDAYIAADGGVVAPEDSSYLFGNSLAEEGPYDYLNLQEIQFNGNLDTSGVTNMMAMFNGCVKIKELDLSTFDTRSVTNLWATFAQCGEMETLNLGSFDTASVTIMYGTFSQCRSLKQLNLESFDTSSVTDMRAMFSNCRSLTRLDLSGFDMSAVTEKDGMFKDCTAVVTW